MSESLVRKITDKFGSTSIEVEDTVEKPKQDVFAEIRRFFEDDIKSDLYSKESIDPSSYRVTGQPCHGGYVDEAQPGPAKHEEDAE